MFTFMTHFGENKHWQQQNCFWSLTHIDFAVLVSSRAVRISSRQGRTCFSGPITSTRTVLIRNLFSYGFPKKLRAGPYGSYDKPEYAPAYWATQLVCRFNLYLSGMTDGSLKIICFLLSRPFNLSYPFKKA